MGPLIRTASQVCTALAGAAAAMVAMAAAAAPAAPSLVQTRVHALDGHRVTLDVYPAAGPLRVAAILSHGFTRSRRALAGHAQALADAGVLALTLDLPCTFDFRCNARALAALVGSLRAGGTFGAPVNRVMLVGFSAGGLSILHSSLSNCSMPCMWSAIIDFRCGCPARSYGIALANSGVSLRPVCSWGNGADDRSTA
jgi:hypothetical protein